MNEAERLHRDCIVIDGLTFYYDGPSTKLQPERVTATNVTVPETWHDFAGAVSAIADCRRQLAADPGGMLVTSVEDILHAKATDRVGIIIGFQSSYPLGTDLNRVWAFRDLGVRIIQLTYNDRTYAGDGCLEPVDGGLSRFGRRLVSELGRAGIVLDLSHVGRRTSLEAIAAADVPPVFTHANPVAVTDNPRNLVDEQLRAVASAGGVVGICCWAPLCWKNRAGNRPTVGDYLDHIDHAVDLMGIDHVGISTDSACTDNQAQVDQHSQEFMAEFPEIAAPYSERVSPDLKHRYPDGLPGVSNLVPITAGLLTRGYGRDSIEKLLGGNFIRVFGQVWSGKS